MADSVLQATGRLAIRLVEVEHLGGVTAIDPGETVGVAAWVNRLELFQCTPEQLFDYLHGVLGTLSRDEYPPSLVDVIVMEEFKLYPWARQAWSTFETVEVIGVVKYLARRAGVKVVMQPASVMGAAAKIARGRGVKLLQPSTGRRAGRDQKAAELHLYAYMQRRGRAGEVVEWQAS